MTSGLAHLRSRRVAFLLWLIVHDLLAYQHRVAGFTAPYCLQFDAFGWDAAILWGHWICSSISWLILWISSNAFLIRNCISIKKSTSNEASIQAKLALIFSYQEIGSYFVMLWFPWKPPMTSDWVLASIWAVVKSFTVIGWCHRTFKVKPPTNIHAFMDVKSF